jgi:predicted DNA-binding transcriptional regulator AlpA
MNMERFVSVRDLCQILGISRTRLYGLVRNGIIPAPLRHTATNRGYWTAEQTDACQRVFKTGVGVNGQPYLPNRKRKSVSTTEGGHHQYESLIASLSALGMTATISQVREAMKRLPTGLDEGAVVKQVFLLLRQNH